MADFQNPKNTNPLLSLFGYVRDGLDSIARMFDGTTDSNVPTGAKKIDGTTKEVFQWNGASWASIGFVNDTANAGAVASAAQADATQALIDASSAQSLTNGLYDGLTVFSSQQVTYPFYAAGVFYIGATSSPNLFRSVDGLNWVPSTIPNAPSGFGASNGVTTIVPSGVSGDVARSVDNGINFGSNISTGLAGAIIGVFHISTDIFVAFSNNNTGACVSRSTDGGVSWTTASPTDGQLLSGAIGGGTIALSGNNEIVYYSTDGGVTWGSTALSGFSTTINSFSYSDELNIFVAGGQKISGSIIFSSTDGIVWTEEMYNLSDNKVITNLTWDGVKFIAWVATGTGYISSDGQTWNSTTVSQDAISGVSAHKAIYGGGRYLYSKSDNALIN